MEAGTIEIKVCKEMAGRLVTFLQSPMEVKSESPTLI
jgi:hypothetical protein